MYNRLRAYLEENELIALKEQIGFKKGSRTSVESDDW